MFGRDWTATQIAVELGGVTRNGVIGKLHRLGLTRGPRVAGLKRPRPARRSPFRKPPVFAPVEAPMPQITIAEPLEAFRRYLTTYAFEQAFCRLSDQLIFNLEKHWNARQRKL